MNTTFPFANVPFVNQFQVPFQSPFSSQFSSQFQNQFPGQFINQFDVNSVSPLFNQLGLGQALPTNTFNGGINGFGGRLGQIGVDSPISNQINTPFGQFGLFSGLPFNGLLNNAVPFGGLQNSIFGGLPLSVV